MVEDIYNKNKDPEEDEEFEETPVEPKTHVIANNETPKSNENKKGCC